MSVFKPHQMSNFAVFSILCLSLGLAFFIPGIMMRLEMIPVPSPYLSVNLCPGKHGEHVSIDTTSRTIPYYSSTFCAGNIYKDFIAGKAKAKPVGAALQPKKKSKHGSASRVLLETKQGDSLSPKSKLVQIKDSKDASVEEKEKPGNHHLANHVLSPNGKPVEVMKAKNVLVDEKNNDNLVEVKANVQVNEKNRDTQSVLASKNVPGPVKAEKAKKAKKAEKSEKPEKAELQKQESLPDLIIPIHDRMLVSNLEYVPVILIPHPLHGDGKIHMSLLDSKGEKLFEVKQKLSSNNMHAYNSVVMTSPYDVGTKIQVYNPYNQASRAPSHLQELQRKITKDKSVKLDKGVKNVMLQEWCEDPIFGCPYEFEHPMKEIILLKSKFFLDSNQNVENFVANLTLKVHSAHLSVANKMVSLDPTLIETQQHHAPALLLGFHQTSLSNIQRSGVGYIIRGIIILLATLALASSRAYLFPQHRHKDKQVTKNELSGTAYCIKNRVEEESETVEEDEAEDIDEQEDYCDDDGEEEQIQRELERAIKEEEVGYISAVFRARS